MVSCSKYAYCLSKLQFDSRDLCMLIQHFYFQSFSTTECIMIVWVWKTYCCLSVCLSACLCVCLCEEPFAETTRPISTKFTKMGPLMVQSCAFVILLISIFDDATVAMLACFRTGIFSRPKNFDPIFLKIKIRENLVIALFPISSQFSSSLISGQNGR